MLDESTQLLAAAAASKEGTPLTFITGLKYDTNVVKALNNLTFLYDPNWEYEVGSPTYPLAFFYVKKQTEAMATETSQRPVLLYNSGASGAGAASAGLTSIIADNIVIKPKVYKLEVLVPMNMDMFFNGGYYNTAHAVTANAFMITNGTSATNKALSQVANISAKTMGILKTLLTALYGTEISASSIVTMMCGQQDYNKSSIEYMWRNRRILKLKLWTGWSFKQLVVQNFEVSKDGTGGAYFEGTLTCQEMPILTLKPSASLSLSFMSRISSVLGIGIKAAVATFIKGMEATAGGKI